MSHFFVVLLLYSFSEAREAEPLSTSVCAQALQTDVALASQSAAPKPAYIQKGRRATEQFINLIQHDVQKGVLNLKALEAFQRALQQMHSVQDAQDVQGEASMPSFPIAQDSLDAQPFPNPILVGTKSTNLNQYRSYVVYEAHIHNHHTRVALLDRAQVLNAIERLIIQHTQSEQERLQLHKKIADVLMPEELEERTNKFVKAAKNGDIEELLYWIPYVKGVNIQNPGGWSASWTALCAAVNWGQPQAVQVLLDHGGDPHCEFPSRYGGLTPMIHVARRQGKSVKSILESFIKAGADPDVADSRGRTPLMEAVRFDNPVAVRQLIDAGADVNAQDEDGYTALMDVSSSYRHSRTNTFELLIEAGADLNMRELSGRTALMLSVMSRWGVMRADRTAQLIQAGARLELRDNRGRSAMDRAIAYGNWSAEQLLIQAGVEPLRTTRYTRRELVRIQDGANPIDVERQRGLWAKLIYWLDKL